MAHKPIAIVLTHTYIPTRFELTVPDEWILMQGKLVRCDICHVESETGWSFGVPSLVKSAAICDDCLWEEATKSYPKYKVTT